MRLRREKKYSARILAGLTLSTENLTLEICDLKLNNDLTLKRLIKELVGCIVR